MSNEHEERAFLRIRDELEQGTLTAAFLGLGPDSRTGVTRGSSSDRSLRSGLQWISFFSFIVLGTACGSMGKPHFQTYGIEKAAFDMQCDKAKLDVVELSSTSVGVRGCGRQGRYEMLPNGDWVLNSAEGASALSSPAGPKPTPTTRPPVAR